MKSAPRRWQQWLTPVGALAVAVLGSCPAGAQEPRPKYTGTAAFRFVMGPHLLNFHPLGTVKDLEQDPEKSLLIVFRDTNVLEEWGAENLKDFLSRGGALLLATDQATGACISTVFHARVTGDHLRASQPEGQYLRKLPDCPVVQPMPGREELFHKVGSLVTNVPSAFQLDRRSPFVTFVLPPRTVAMLPPAYDRQGRRFGALPFALEYQWRFRPDSPACRVLMLADQDVFIDGMMFQKENDNFVFAYNALRWLSDSGQRDRVLFLDDGQPVTSFDVPLKWKWSPTADIPNPVALADVVLAELEKKNFFNRVVSRAVPTRVILSTLAVLITLVLVARWLYHTFFRRAGVETGVPLLAGNLIAVPSPVVLEQREQALLQADNLWETAHHLAQQCFERQLPSSPGGDPTATMEQSVLQVTGPRWQNWTLGVQARRLWNLAYSSRPRRVSRRELATLVAWSAEVQQALHDGRLSLTRPTTDNRRTPKA